jgi:hypothetical protein
MISVAPPYTAKHKKIPHLGKGKQAAKVSKDNTVKLSKCAKGINILKSSGTLPGVPIQRVGSWLKRRIDRYTQYKKKAIRIIVTKNVEPRLIDR